MGDAGPTRGHSGMGVRSHIEEKSPKPMATVVACGRNVVAGGGCRPTDGRGSRWRGRWVSQRERKSAPLASVRLRGYCNECVLGPRWLELWQVQLLSSGTRHPSPSRLAYGAKQSTLARPCRLLVATVPKIETTSKLTSLPATLTTIKCPIPRDNRICNQRLCSSDDRLKHHPEHDLNSYHRLTNALPAIAVPSSNSFDH